MAKGMNRTGFVRAVGAGAAGMAGAAMLGSGVASAASPPHPTLHEVEALQGRGMLRVAVANENLPGLFEGWVCTETDPMDKDTCLKWELDPNPNNVKGIVADFSRAIAAAVFGHANVDNKIKFFGADSTTRWLYLYGLNGLPKVDVVMREVTHTLGRDMAADFAPVYYYDGADVLINTPVPSGAKIAVGTGTTTQSAVENAKIQYGLDWVIVPYSNSSTAKQAYLDGDADGWASDTSQLIGLVLAESLQGSTERYFSTNYGTLLSKEPLAACVREDDSNWRDIVNWVFWVLFEAEERGVTKNNVNTSFGAGLGVDLGLVENWPYYVIKAVGNYGEIWKRNLTDEYPGAFDPRGLNALWTDGGLLYSPAFR